MTLKIKTLSSKNIWLAGLTANLILGLLAFLTFNARMISLDYYQYSFKLRLLAAILLIVFGFNLLLILLMRTSKGESIKKFGKKVNERIERLRGINLLIFIALLLFYPIFFNNFKGFFLPLPIFRLWFFW